MVWLESSHPCGSVRASLGFLTGHHEVPRHTRVTQKGSESPRHGPIRLTLVRLWPAP